MFARAALLDTETNHDTPAWLRGLNDEQRHAVLHDGPAMLVVAGAGSGKTRTLVGRVARLVAEGADPDRILLLTFSRRAAREMLGRARHMVASTDTAKVWGGTFHAVANRMLREHGAAVGLGPGFTILDQGDAVDLIGVVRAELGLGERARRFPKKETVLDIYSRVANAQEQLSLVLERRFPWCRDDGDDLRAVFAAYAERKRSRQVVDYDDLLLYWRALLQSTPLLAGRFDHVLVDEYQDTNILQADIVAGLSSSGRGLFVVGDDAQAIYGFRAASTDNMTTFAARFVDASVVTLDRNYRSTQPILDVASAVIAGARGTYPKSLRAARTDVPAARPTRAIADDDAAEAAFVCERVLEHRELGVALRDQAVLFRTGHHSGRLELELTRRNIPFVKFGGLKVLEAAHIKDLLAFLRLMENPSDELAWHRVLGLLDGVGPATARKVLDHLRLPNPLAVRTVVYDLPEVPPRARADLDVLKETLGTCLEVDPSDGPAVEIEVVRRLARPLFERRYPDASVRLEDFDQLQSMAAGCGSRAAFLSELTIDPPSLTSDLAGPPLLDDDYLILSTIHSAKGGEWDVVFVIHASDGNIPSDMALTDLDGLEEERRLLYVALTRARDHLYVTYPLRYYHRKHSLDDPHTYGQPSRFLTPAVRALMQEPAAEQRGALAGANTVVGPDRVSGELAALWA